MKNKKPEWEINEPRFNPLNYNESLLTNLNYYAVEVDSKLKQEWALTYYKEQGFDTKGLDKLNPMFFDQAGVLARLVERGVSLNQMNRSYLETKFHTLKQSIEKTQKSEKKEKVIEKVSEVIKTWHEANSLLTEVDADTDSILVDDLDPKTIRIKLLIQELKLKKDDFDFIKKVLNRKVTYFNEILNDKDQLAEAYKHIPKKAFKRAITYLESIISMCGISRVLRNDNKVKIKKEKSPTLLVKSLQYLIEDKELNIKSINPEKIINATEVWVYDTEKRKLGKYKADEGNKLTVKGTTILNWSFELSSQKTVRKPNEVINKFLTENKSSLNKIYKDIKAVDMEVKGRTNKDLLILRVF